MGMQTSSGCTWHKAAGRGQATVDCCKDRPAANLGPELPVVDRWAAPMRGSCSHTIPDTVLAPCRTAAWLEAVLSRPSFVETAPSYDCVMTGFGPFIAPMKD